MTALSIRNMNRTLDELDRIRDAQVADLPNTGRPMFYWHFQRKTKRGWKFMRDYYGSAKAAGEFFIRHFVPGQHRMRRMASYETRTHNMNQTHVDSLNNSIAQIS